MLKNNLKYSTIVGLIFLFAIISFGLSYFRGAINYLDYLAYYEENSEETKEYIYKLIGPSVIFVMGVLGSIGVIAQRKWGQKLCILTLVLILLNSIFSMIYITPQDKLFILYMTIMMIIILGFVYLLLINERLTKEWINDSIIEENE